MRIVFDYSSESEAEQAPKPKKLKFTVPAASIEVSSEAKAPCSRDDLDDFVVPQDPEVDETFNAKTNLDTSILNSSSIGFRMMEKMGFKVGQSLGVVPDRPGADQPIFIRPKADRAGLGSTAEVSSELAAELKPKPTISSLRDGAKLILQQRSDLLSYRKLQRVCFQLSGDEDALSNGTIVLDDVHHLWRDYAMETTNSEVQRLHADSPASDVLDIMPLLDYSRTTFFYCPYCSIRFEDQDDMDKHCPGITEAPHKF